MRSPIPKEGNGIPQENRNWEEKAVVMPYGKGKGLLLGED